MTQDTVGSGPLPTVLRYILLATGPFFSLPGFPCSTGGLILAVCGHGAGHDPCRTPRRGAGVSVQVTGL